MARSLTALLFLIGSCGALDDPGPLPSDPPASSADIPLVLTNVRLVPMQSAGTTAPRTVVISEGIIQAIGGEDTPRPAGAVVIEGQGRYLMPALIDMHVHIRPADLPRYPRAGIATVRNMWGWPGLQELAERVNRGELEGPRIISASNGLDAEPVQWPYTRVVSAPADGEAAVREAVQAGWAYLKVYTRLSRESYLAIMAAARAQGIVPVGHVPFAVPVEEALAQGQRSIEHLTGYDRAVSRSGRTGTGGWTDADPARYPALAELSRSSGVWNCPTLAIYVALSAQSSPAERAAIVGERRRFVAELARAGARLLAGSDAGIEVVAPGTSLHDELAELVGAGLTPYAALRAATADAAAFLGIPGLGSVTVGAPADLLLVGGNPLEGLATVRAFHGLIQRGAWKPS